jgi:hypothetical protein
MKTKLIALVALSVAAFPFLAADVPDGAEFEAEPADAEGLLTAGHARLAEPTLASTPPTPPTQKEKSIKARVLVACSYGQPDDLVELPAAQVKAAERDGLVDADKAAVAYAAALPQNKRG